MIESNNHKIENRKRVIVITGCDTGIGKSLVEILLDRGYTVVQSYLEKNLFKDVSQVYSKKMDIRVPQEIEDFCKYVKEICSDDYKLEALIPNAGVALGGPIENLPMKIYRESFQINYFGVVEVVQALIPELIESRGRILVNGSMAGRVALPFMSPYVSTKYALEGFCDSLRRELNPFGIKTILLEPAAVATPIWNKAKEQDISFVDSKYMDSLYRFRDKFIEGGNQGMNVELAASYIVDILHKKRPKARYIVAKNRLTSKLLFFMPSLLLDKVFKKMFYMNYGTDPKKL